MKKVISEDNTMYNVQRQQFGSTARQDSKGDTAPQPNQVKNLVQANKRDDNSQAPFLKPYPLDRVDEVLSDLYINNVNLRKILQTAWTNPALKKKYKDNLRYVYKRVEFMDKLLVDISKEFDKIQ